ncbi:MAG: hypothetical protein LBS03_07850 [Bacteroidales bacterium]|nr:hypothetical protein [Bacteroidales bacterium]
MKRRLFVSERCGIASMVCIVTGVPLLVIGTVKKGKALRAYARTLAGLPQKSHFQINAHRGGLGMAYVF